MNSLRALRCLRSSAAVTLALLAPVPDLRAGPGEDESFMPKGGRSVLLELMATPAGAAQWKASLAAHHTEQEWVEIVAGLAPAATPSERATLAAYLSVNLPLASVPAAGASSPATLPRDGRELAWQQCQFCHSLFTSYLTQQRDLLGWRSLFLSPFHREMKMTPQEREEFARYSALNMPMKIDDVPPELRF